MNNKNDGFSLKEISNTWISIKDLVSINDIYDKNNDQ